jgi:hypothetical protein
MLWRNGAKVRSFAHELLQNALFPGDDVAAT